MAPYDERGRLEAAPVALGLTDESGRMTWANTRLRSLFGLPGGAVGTAVDGLFVRADRPAVRRLLAGVDRRVEVRGVRSGRPPFWVALEIGEATPDGLTVLAAFDVDAARRLENGLRDLADHDPLTGLLNRRRLEEELRRTLDAVGRYGRSAGLVFIDLDELKVVNDRHGHGAGDDLLRRVADTLASRTRASDVLARLSGDEFAVLVPEVPGDAIGRIAEQLLEALREVVFTAGGEVIRVRASAGAALLRREDAWDAAAAIAAADTALLRAKAEGRDRARLYTPGAQPPATAPASRAALRAALDEGRFTLRFQPVVDVSTARVAWMEVLVRLIDEDTGRLINPTAFLGAAERYGMTAELDAWVLGTLADMQLPDCGLNVNLCAGTLSGDDALVMVDALLRAREGGPGVLVEVPEAAATRSPRELERLGRRLAERGGQLAVDDFGVNVAGLRAIERAPVSLAKLDAELTRQLVDNHGDRMVVEALIRLGHGLGWQVAIKCIPDEESLKAAIGLGARFVQGFHVAPPLTAEEASEFAREPVAALAQHAGQA